jgi:cytochrome c
LASLRLLDCSANIELFIETGKGLLDQTKSILLKSVLLFMTCSAAVADENDDASVVYGFGTPATAEEIAAWDIDVRPDGKGLPSGSGTPAEGAQLYAVRCAACHGTNGEGGLNDRLVVRSPDEPFPDAGDADTWAHRTVGNYWPYATTLFDYIRRSMPFTQPGSLEADEVYALTAHLLYLNNIIPADAEMNAQTLPDVEMPARGKFVLDDRQKYQEVH